MAPMLLAFTGEDTWRTNLPYWENIETMLNVVVPIFLGGSSYTSAGAKTELGDFRITMRREGRRSTYRAVFTPYDGSEASVHLSHGKQGMFRSNYRLYTRICTEIMAFLLSIHPS